MNQEIVFDQRLASLKNLAWWFYIFHAFSMLFTLGALSIIPVILSYVYRSDAAGTFVYSHHNWQISSFWIYIGCLFVCLLLTITIIGIPLAWLLGIGAWLWKAYRLIIGIQALNNNQPIGDASINGAP